MPVQEKISVSAGRLTGGNEAVAEAEIAAKVEGRRFVIEKPVGAEFHLKTVLSFRPDRSSRSLGLLENRDIASWNRLLEPESDGQPGDAGADDDNPAHSFFPANLRFEHKFEPIFDFLVGLVHFFIGQGPILGLVNQMIGQALSSSWNTLTLEHIKETGAF